MRMPVPLGRKGGIDVHAECLGVGGEVVVEVGRIIASSTAMGTVVVEGTL